MVEEDFEITPEQMLKGHFRPHPDAPGYAIRELVSRRDLEAAHARGGDAAMFELVETRWQARHTESNPGA